jgi:hypothetical protein
MLRYITGIVATHVIRDADTNNLSAIQILDELHPGGFPTYVPFLTVVFVLRKQPNDPDNYNFTLRGSIGDAVLADQAMEANFQGKLRTRLIFAFAGFPLPKPGTLVFTLVHNNQDLGTCDIEIYAPERAQPAANAAV